MRPQLLGDRALARIDRILAAPRRRQQLLGGAQPIALELEPLVLAGLELRLVQLLELKAQELLALGARALVERRRSERARRRLDARVRRRHRRQQLVVPAERVEDAQVLRRIAERLMLVLPGQLDEHAGDLAERRRGRQHIIDVDAAAPALPITRRTTSPSSTGSMPGARQPLDERLGRRPVRRLEDRLDARLLGAVAHHVRRRAPAAQAAPPPRRAATCRRRSRR